MGFTEKFEEKFLAQGPYENRDIFNSLDIAWELLRIFQPELLKKIPAKIKDKYYDRENWAKNTGNKLSEEDVGEQTREQDEVSWTKRTFHPLVSFLLWCPEASRTMKVFSSTAAMRHQVLAALLLLLAPSRSVSNHGSYWPNIFTNFPVASMPIIL